MSLFDNVRTLKVDDDMKLMLVLRYGEPTPTEEYFARLPASGNRNRLQKT